MAACRAAEWAGWICKEDGRARRVQTARISRRYAKNSNWRRVLARPPARLTRTWPPIFAVDAGRLRKLERGAERIVDAITSGLRSEALCKRLAATEVQLEQLRPTSRVIDLKAIMAAIPAAIERYRTLVVR